MMWVLLYIVGTATLLSVFSRMARTDTITEYHDRSLEAEHWSKHN